MLISRRPSVLFSRRLTNFFLTLFAVDLILHPSALILISWIPPVLSFRRLTNFRLTLFAADLMFLFHRSWIFSRRLFRGSAVSCSPRPPSPSQLAVDFSTVSVHLVSKSVGTIQLNSGRLPKPTPKSILTIAQSKSGLLNPAFLLIALSRLLSDPAPTV